MAVSLTGALRGGETVRFLWCDGRKKSFYRQRLRRQFVLMSKRLTPTDFGAVIGLYNVETLDRRQEILNRTIAWPETSRTISVKCGLAGLKAAVSVNP
jgi:hypothetical protein